MLYLESFKLPSKNDEDSFVLSYPYQLEMECYTHNVYPFKVFPPKKLEQIDFEPVTIFYGSNGSGKSTLLNVIAEKLNIPRQAPFNKTPYYKDFLSFCKYSLYNRRTIPEGSKIISSDDVFNFILDIRAINEGISERREEIFAEYADKKANRYQLKSLDDYDELKKHNEAKKKTKSQYTAARLKTEICSGSNGESGFSYFANEIKANGIYLLDEPENSLSVKKQEELLHFLEDSARFYNCQLIIATHSPILLSMKGAKIYDLDSSPVTVRNWTDLENVRIWFDFFEKNRDFFLK